MGLTLRELELKDEVAARAAHLEFPDWEFLIPLDSTKKVTETPWPEHIEDCRKMRLGVDLPKGRVPATFFIAEVNGEIVGRASIRHELNKYLFNYGGHIGYGVRPQFRRRGYATEILHQSLRYIRGLGVEEVLITCLDENIGSVKVIESCGGTLENIVDLEGKPLRRYWIKK